MSGLIYQNLTPGQQASRESVEKRLLWGPVTWYVPLSVILNSTTVDARSSVTTDLLPGLVLGKITSTGKYVHYSPTATDGSQIAQGVLMYPVQMLDSTATARDQLATMIVAGAVKSGELGGIDQFARAHLYGRMIFDDAPVGNSFGWRDVVAKTANYTVTAADNNAIFTNQGATAAVTFTLPTLAKGLRYKFFAEAAQDVHVVSATADTMVVFNDAAADSININTSNEIIGGSVELVANADATKWLVMESIHDGQTLVVAT